MRSALAADIAQLESAYQHFLCTGQQSSGLSSLGDRVFSAATEALNQGVLDKEDIQRLYQMAGAICTIRGAMADLHSQTARIESDIAQEVRTLYGPVTPCHPGGDTNETRDGSDHLPLRHWFLAHFDYPYPDEKAYTFLGEQLPSMTRHQIATWFINARRRSGWTDFRRDFAEEDYHNFQHLLATIDAPGNEAAKKRYDKVRLYFEPARKDVVSETILEVIKQKTPKDLPPKPAPARAAQRVKKRAARGIGAQHDEEDELAPAVQGSWSPRRRNDPPVASSSPSPAPSFDPIFDFHRNTTPSPGSGSGIGVGLPRPPSAFVSPATSARSFSESSSSSLDSLVSYGSSNYAPQIQRMEPTMPSAGAPVISVAPQQQQRTSTSSSQILAFPALDFPHVRPGPSTFSSPSRPHPYFCTLNELPTVPSFRGGFANSIPQ